MGDRGSNGLILLLLAVVGGSFFVRGPQSAAEPSDTSARPVLDVTSTAASPDDTAFLRPVWEFLSAEPPRSASAVQLREYALRARYNVSYLIATVPDPMDSQVGWLFDSFLAAIRRAAEANGYVMDRFSLPWTSGRDSVDPDPRHRREPGIVLFRGGDELLILLLVGETPTTGIHKLAFQRALRAATEGRLPARTGRSNWYEQRSFVERRASEGNSPLRVLGPTFSGSVPSLRLSVCEWYGAGAPPIRFVSGSATTVDKRLLEELSCPEGKPEVQFYTTVHPDDHAFPLVKSFLQDEVSCEGIALLIEGNTSYGRALLDRKPKTRSSSKPRKGEAEGEEPADEEESVASSHDQQLDCHPDRITYPAHISSLRSAYESDRRGARSHDTGSLSFEEYLSPTLTEGERIDLLPSMSPRATARATEQELGQVLTSISTENFGYVGLLATNVRDKVFLAQELYTHFPDVRFFTLESDLLLAHPQFRPYLMGSLVVSTYPLYNRAQVWSFPQNTGVWMQFSNSGAQGLYNATILQMAPRKAWSKTKKTHTLVAESEEHWPMRLMDYGPPLGSEGPWRPPIWLSVVGRNGFWPLELLAHDEHGRKPPVEGWGYVLAVDWEAPESSRARKQPLSKPMYAMVILILLVFSAYPPLRVLRGADSTAGSRSQFVPWIPKLFVLLTFQCLVLLLCGLSWLRLSPEGQDPRDALVGIVVASAAILVTLLALLITVRRRRAAAQSTSTGGPESPSVGTWLNRAIGRIVISGLAIMSAFALLWFAWRKQDDSVTDVLFFLQRSVYLANGVSALVPIGLLLLVAYVYTMCRLRQASLLEMFDLPDEMRSLKRLINGPLVEIASRLKSQLRMTPTLGHLAVMAPFLTVVTFALWRHDNPITIDGDRFTRFIVTGFILVFLLTSWTLFRALSFWRVIRDFMRHLEHHWAIRIYDSRRARHLARLGGRIRARIPRLVEFCEPLQQLEKLRAGFGDIRDDLGKKQRDEFQEILRETKGLGRRLEHDLASVEHYRDNFNLRSKDSYKEIQEVAKQVFEVIGALQQPRPGDDSTEDQGKDGENVGKDGPEDGRGRRAAWEEWLLDAAEFAAVFPANVIRHSLAHLRNLLLFSCVASVLLLGALVNYPFQPRRILLLVIGTLIISSVTVTSYLLLKIERSSVISRMAGTKPGVTWDRSLLPIVLILVILPLLGLISAQFPTLSRDLARLLGPVLRVLG